MSATLTSIYRRSAHEARRIAEAFRACTRGVNGKLLRTRVAELAASELPEGPEGRHSAAYLSAITEVAAEGLDANRDDARAFAKAFVGKPSDYSRTQAGLSAIQLEAWLIENGGGLYQHFVETVLDGGATNYLAIFEGKLSDQDKDKLRGGTGAFVKMEPIAEAGAVNHDDGEILEFSMFDCTAVGKAKADDVLPNSVDDPDQTTSGEAKTMKSESLLPTSRDDYDRVFEQEGITRSVAMYLFGAQAVHRAAVEDGRLAIKDANGVRWLSENGDTWLPDVDSLNEKCAPEDDADEPEDDEEDDDEADESLVAVHETNKRTGAMRSFCNTWAVFDNPVLVEGVTKPATIVSARERAWVVERPIEEARALVTQAAACYADSPVEGDLYIEAALAEYAEEHGTPCVNETEVLQLVNETEDRPTRADRDYDVKIITTRRLSEALGHGGYDAQALCSVAEQALKKKAPGMASWAYFDNRFGKGGQVFVKFYNAPANASDVDKLNSSPNFTLSISPFDTEGRASAPKIKAVMIAGYPRDMPWRGKTAPVDAMARYLEAFIEKLELSAVVEADDEEDDTPDDEPEVKGKTTDKPKEGKPRNPS